MAAIHVGEACRICVRALLLEASGDHLLDHALAWGAPRIAHIEVGTSVSVIVQPCGAHAGPEIFHARRGCYVTEPAAIIPVQVVSAKIIRYVEVRPAVVIIIAPRRSEAVSIIVLAQTYG